MSVTRTSDVVRTMGLLTVLHPFVDAASVALFYMTGRGLEAFLGYNFCAFALQFPLGIVLDAFPQLLRGAFALGVTLVAGGCLFGLWGCAGLPILCLACLGNALFHLSGGKLILDRTDGAAEQVGVFIATGAIGVFAGTSLAGHCPVPFVLTVVLALSVVGALTLRGVDFGGLRGVEFSRMTHLGVLITFFLVVLVAWRGHVGLAASRPPQAGLVYLLVGLAVTVAGKAVGGFFVRWTRRWPLVLVSVCGSLLLYFGIGTSSVPAWLVVVFLAQLATGVVLSLMYTQTKGASGVSFGLNCLGLFIGVL